MTYDRTRLDKLGERRRAALAELAAIRRAVIEELPVARGDDMTWREISARTTYTEQQLRSLTLPEAEREEREEKRRTRRRKRK